MKFDVVTIGAATRDVFVETERFKIIETGVFEEGRAECLPLGAKIEVDGIVFTTGGGGTNAAVAFARMNLTVASLVRVGVDGRGEAVRKELESETVITSFLQLDDDRPTGYAILLLNPSGERTVLVQRGASSAISPDEISWGDINAKWFYITSLGGNFELLERAVNEAGRRGVKVFLDPGSQELRDRDRLFATLKKVDVLKFNLEEAARLVNIDHKEKEDVFRALQGTTKGIVIVTDGANGVDVYDGRRTYHAGTFKERAPKDRTGAGDAFGAGFVAGLLRSDSIAEAIRVGSANATSVIEHVGTKKGLLRLVDLDDSRWSTIAITEEAVSGEV